MVQTITINSDDYEPVELDDMGDECIVLSQCSEGGKVERVVMSHSQLKAALDATTLRYRDGDKNTDRLQAV